MPTPMPMPMPLSPRFVAELAGPRTRSEFFQAQERHEEESPSHACIRGRARLGTFVACVAYNFWRVLGCG